MMKLVVMTILLLMAAYCSYQITSILNWQQLLRNKQKTFGVFVSGKGHRLTWMKQLRMVSVTCAALVLLVPSRFFPFQSPTQMSPGAWLRSETNEKSTDLDNFDGLKDNASDEPKSGVQFSAGDQTTLDQTPITSSEENTPKSTLLTTSATSFDPNALTVDVPSAWARVQEKQSLIEEVVIEATLTKVAALTEEQMMTYLTKQLVLTDVSMIADEAQYVVSIHLSDGSSLDFLLVIVDEVCYVLDEANNLVYRLS